MAAPGAQIYPSAVSAEFAAALTPHDSTDLSVATRGLYVGTGGNVVVVMASDTAAVTFSNVPAGAVLPVRAIRVNSTNTTASNIVALW